MLQENSGTESQYFFHSSYDKRLKPQDNDVKMTA